MIDDRAEEKKNEFVVPQAAIDHVLTGGSSYSEGKLRIYEQFQKQETTDKNIAFLKSEYGIGGSSDAIPESGYSEDHDGKGITIHKGYKSSPDYIGVTLTWNTVAKRIAELIAADRYLNAKEKERYPQYLREKEAQQKRAEIAEKFESVIQDYKDFIEQTKETDVTTDRWYLVSCGSAFTVGDKKMYARTGEGDFILPMMRDAMNAIIKADTHLTERCREVLSDLDGDIAKPFEPTYDELNPPPEPEKEYRFSLGDSVYIGTKEYDILGLEDPVVLYAPSFPILTHEMPKAEFEQKIKENPLNDKYLQVVELQKEISTTEDIPDTEDYVFIDPEHEEIAWIYFNPDANSGDQYVVNTMSFDHFIHLVDSYPFETGEVDFEDQLEELVNALDSGAAQRLADVNTPHFLEVQELYHDNPDYIGLSKENIHRIYDQINSIRADKQAEQEINAYEAEFGADGTRIFHDVEKLPVYDRATEILYGVLHALKMDDVGLDFEGEDILAFDDEGNRWKGKEFFRFLIDECFVFEDDGSVVGIDNELLADFTMLASHNDVLLIDNRLKEPWREYMQTKFENSGAIVLYRIGDFFEVMGDDAEKIAQTLDLHLTSRDVGLGRRVPMCGMPENRLDAYMGMLHDRGYDVVLYEDGKGRRVNKPPLTLSQETMPVARIDYLADDGHIEMSIDYTDEGSFLRDLFEENKAGTKMTIVLYRDENGHIVPDNFASELKPPSPTVNIEDSPFIKGNREAELDWAKRLINEYCQMEFSQDADYSDLTSVDLAFTTVGDADISAQVNVNLEDFSVDRYLGDVLVERRKYDSMRELCDALEDLDFGELTDFTDEQIEQAEKSISDRRTDEMLKQAEQIAAAADVGTDERFHVIELDRGSKIAYGIWDDITETYYVDEAGVTEEFDSKWQAEAYCKEVQKRVSEREAKEWLDVERSKNEAAPESAVELTPPPQKARRDLTPHILYPEIKSDYRTNFKIDKDDIGVGTPLERFRHNIMAIQLLHKLEDEHRLADTNEQRILAEYVGWGGLTDFFKEDHPHYDELRAVLTDDELASARASTLTAFYTPPVVIKSIYRALENMGFKNGNILEPSCGVGNFMGLLPESMGESKIYGVELDNISGRIAQQLYQKNNIAVQGFEDTELPDSFFDAAVGNVPFETFKVPDKKYDKYNFLIHDYFFARTLDKVRPGGVIAFITSHGTMDKENPAVRKYIAQRADLLGAIRLPNDTFKDAAGTEVTADVLFLQKRDRLIDLEPDWVHLNTDENGITMNQYFIDNPDMIVGEMKMVSGPHGDEPTCEPYEDQTLAEGLNEAIQNIHAQITEYEYDDLIDEGEDKSIPADPSVRNFSYTVADGQIYYRENSRMNPIEASVTAENRIKSMIKIRDCVRELIEYQTEDVSDDLIRAKQTELNELYDAFSKKYGLINSRANSSAFSADSAYFLLCSLEVLDDEGSFVRKADMFSKRTIRQKVAVTSVDTASEALALSLAEKTTVDMPYMCELTGKTEEEIAEELHGVIFLNPQHLNDDDWLHPKYLPADEYLSGNIRKKLELAKRSAELYPEDYTVNVQALERVMPKDLSASEISVRLGSTWLPVEDVNAFIWELFGTPFWQRRNICAHFADYTGEWNIEGKSYDRGNVKVYNTYGTSRKNGYQILEETLNLRDVRIFDYQEDADGKRTAVLNKKETAIAQGKQQLIKEAFNEWIWKDPERRGRLTKLYNEKFNSTSPREYDGSHLNFVGMNPEIQLRLHQVNAIAHILYGGNTLLAHVVGAGKTYEMVAAAQESKRLGLCRKSLFVVPNHLTEQWAAEYLQLYPSANILVATKKGL